MLDMILFDIYIYKITFTYGTVLGFMDLFPNFSGSDPDF